MLNRLSLWARGVHGARRAMITKSVGTNEKKNLLISAPNIITVRKPIILKHFIMFELTLHYHEFFPQLSLSIGKILCATKFTISQERHNCFNIFTNNKVSLSAFTLKLRTLLHKGIEYRKPLQFHKETTNCFRHRDKLLTTLFFCFL